MSEVETIIRRGLDRMVPLPGEERRDWQDVVKRSGSSGRSWRRPSPLRLAAAVALAAGLAAAGLSPAGSAVVHSMQDFSSWLRGVPGTKASNAERQSFERDYRGWLGSADQVELRRLVRARVDDTTFSLLGFRRGDSVCLRTEARGEATGSNVSCAPLSAFRAGREPGVVLAVDEFFQAPVRKPGHRPRLFAATVGIVANRVAAVDVRRTSGHAAAVVGNQAFLSVVPGSAADRVREISVSTMDGGRAVLPVARILSGVGSAPGGRGAAPPGPTTVDRSLDGGTIGWLDRQEPRGSAVPSNVRLPRGTVLYRRLVTPTPDSLQAVAVSLMGPNPPVNPLLPGKGAICFDLVVEGAGGGGCTTPDEIFATEPFTTGASLLEGGDQFETLFGVAADGVDHMEAFLSDGSRLVLPFRDNAYLAEIARSSLPVRIVAYDRENRVVGIQIVEGI